MAVLYPRVRLWLAAFIFTSDSRVGSIDVEDWQVLCVYDSRKELGRDATCGVAGHGVWRGDRRNSTTKVCAQCGLG